MNQCQFIKNQNDSFTINWNIDIDPTYTIYSPEVEISSCIIFQVLIINQQIYISFIPLSLQINYFQISQFSVDFQEEHLVRKIYAHQKQAILASNVQLLFKQQKLIQFQLQPFYCQKVPVGLYNKSNFCYFNCILQLLFNFDEFHIFFEQKNKTSELLLQIYLQYTEYLELQQINQNFKINTSQIISQLQLDGQQQDITEFFYLLMGYVFHQLDNLELLQFQIQFVKNNCSDDIDNFMRTNINPTQSLQQAVQSLIKEHDYVKTNELLMITPQRAYYNIDQQQMYKNNDCLIFDMEMKINNCNYNLMAIITHIGTATSGHYQVYIQSSKQWHLINDNIVKLIDEQNILLLGNQKLETPVLFLYQNQSINTKQCTNLNYNNINKIKEQLKMSNKNNMLRIHILQDESINFCNIIKYPGTYITINKQQSLNTSLEQKTFIIVINNQQIFQVPSLFSRHYPISLINQGQEITIIMTENCSDNIFRIFQPGMSNNDLIKYVGFFNSSYQFIQFFNNKKQCQMNFYFYYDGKLKPYNEISSYHQQIIVAESKQDLDSVQEVNIVTQYEINYIHYVNSITQLNNLEQLYVNLTFAPLTDFNLQLKLQRKSLRSLYSSLGDQQISQRQQYFIKQSQVKLPIFNIKVRKTDSFQSLSQLLIVYLDSLDVFNTYQIFLPYKDILLYSNMRIDGKQYINSIQTLSDSILEDSIQNIINYSRQSISQLSVQTNHSFLQIFQPKNMDQIIKTKEVEDRYKDILIYYRIPIIDKKLLQQLRPVRTIVSVFGFPLVDLICWFQQGIGQINISDLMKYVQIQLIHLINVLDTMFSQKNYLILAVEAVNGFYINTINSEQTPNTLISQLRGYPLDQKTIFRLEIFSQQNFKIIQRGIIVNDRLQYQTHHLIINNEIDIEKQILLQIAKFNLIITNPEIKNSLLALYKNPKQNIYLEPISSQFQLLQYNGLPFVNHKINKIIPDIQ
ncbi:Ubiquitin carboxyl-terminal hydrolase domain-containing protein [Spironucleus salmonicida]|uniref:ubiquitinyl hydrolase 1 n=1 Tax=Spironucleus salmonicida TaxID=348837 RepID=V6LTF8_9EUKA|nr:Ubiquitin carboxyl-terminal hydrolase domain-containing protein [Spironucleus salmonicida]|eukprot:EST44074.1 Ubiquitin carboxyl-terminal hydrolase domain-containing protein [Spironucleus salmonicida]